MDHTTPWQGASKASKGKAVDRSETSPLLGSDRARSASRHTLPRAHAAQEPHRPRRRAAWRHHLVTALFVLCSILLVALLALALVAWSYTRHVADSARIASSIRLDSVHKVDVLDINDRGVWVQADVLVRVDADHMLGIGERTWGGRAEDQDEIGAAWWEDMRTRLGRWAIGRIGTVEARVPQAATVHGLHPDVPLATVFVNDTITVSPHLAGPPSLVPASIVLAAQPTGNTTDLLQYAESAWRAGRAKVRVEVPRIEVALVGTRWWNKYAKREVTGLIVPLEVETSSIPGMPAPGTDIASLINLESYSFRSIRERAGDTSHKNSSNATTDTLVLSAVASAPNIAGGIQADFPYCAAFEIWLPGKVPLKVADVATSPLSLHGQDTVNVTIGGQVEIDDTADNAALSTFLRKYLAGETSQVIVQGSARNGCPGGRALPKWLQSIVSQVRLAVEFDGPQPPPELIESVTIEDMKIAEKDGEMTASGVVVAMVRLPEEFRHVHLDIVGVKPDVLVFNGDASAGGDIDPSEPPYPAAAFGRVHPEAYLPSTTERTTSDSDLLEVRAPIKDVPLEILEGRNSVLTDFVTKIIFRGGAEAGVKGVAAVQAKIGGIRAQLELEKLPVSGSFKVGRPRT